MTARDIVHCLALLLAGCGGGPDTEEASGAGHAAGQRGAPAAGARPEPGQERVRPQRNFSAQRVPRGPRHDALAAAVDPAHPTDPWPSEQAALGAEVALEFLFTSLASGVEPAALQGVLTQEPTLLLGEEELRGAAAIERLRDLSDLDVGLRGEPIARVHVIACDEPREDTSGPRKALLTTMRVSATIGLPPEALG
ncbi:MAG: hypothetical protein VX460_08450, partial [Planctomycetota bacterium]|nr:hypothetical protein [Planctomycetota bacterium]